MKLDILTDRQKRWLKHKCNWEHMTQKAVLKAWTPPPDNELTPCGCSVCGGCPICDEEKQRLSNLLKEILRPENLEIGRKAMEDALMLKRLEPGDTLKIGIEAIFKQLTGEQ